MESEIDTCSERIHLLWTHGGRESQESDISKNLSKRICITFSIFFFFWRSKVGLLVYFPFQKSFTKKRTPFSCFIFWIFPYGKFSLDPFFFHSYFKIFISNQFESTVADSSLRLFSHGFFGREFKTDSDFSKNSWDERYRLYLYWRE